MFTIVVSLVCLLQFGTCAEKELFRKVLRHPSFRKYAQSKLSCSQAAKEIAALYEVNESRVLEILHNLCNASKVEEDLLSSLKSIISCMPDVNLVGWIDIPAAEWDVIRPKFLNLLEEVFADLTSTLPDLKEGKKVIRIDQDVEEASLLNCRGIKTIPFTLQTKSACFRFLRTIQRPQIIEAGRSALRRVINTVGFSHSSDTNQQISMVDLCAPAIAASLAGRSGPLFDDVFSSPQVQNIFEQVASFVGECKIFGFNGIDFKKQPPDVDTMALCISAAVEHEFVNEAQASKMLDLIISNVDAQGTLLVYMDEARPRIDLVSIANVLFLAYLLGKESHPVIRYQELLVQEFLLSEGYKWGTRYYPRPECFLFYYGRLLHRFRNKVPRYEQLVDVIKAALLKLCDSSSPQMATAKRIILSSMFDMAVNELDIDVLLQSQQSDGSWPFTQTWFLPTRNCWLHNPALERVFILAALLHT